MNQKEVAQITRGEVVYRLKHKGYTYQKLGNLFNVTKQRAYGIYWQYWRSIREEDAQTCDLCERPLKSVKWRDTHYKLCRVCWKRVIRLKRTKWQSIPKVTPKEHHQKDTHRQK